MSGDGELTGHDAMQGVHLRPMTAEDVPAVLEIQEPAAVLGLAAVFSQAAHPFPRSPIGDRWLEEMATRAVDCYVVLQGGALAGFAAVHGDELLHFGAAVERWGSGAAQAGLAADRRAQAKRGWTLTTPVHR